MLELEMDLQAPKISREFEMIGGETRQTLALLRAGDMRGSLESSLSIPSRRPPFL